MQSKQDSLNIVTLTSSNKRRILQTMSPKQLSVLEKYSMWKARSDFYTKHYLKNTDWVFMGMHIDYGYGNLNEEIFAGKQALYCDCGRRLKYQYELKSIKTNQKLCLGVRHFCNHLGIPQSVANEIKKSVNEINIYTDEILNAYWHGRRFPKNLYERACKLKISNVISGKLAEKYADYYHANLPLFHSDLKRLHYWVESRESEILEEQKRLKLISRQVNGKKRQQSTNSVKMYHVSESDSYSGKKAREQVAEDLSHEYIRKVNYLHIIEPSLENIVSESSYRDLFRIQTQANKNFIWILGNPLFQNLRETFVEMIIEPLNKIEFKGDVVQFKNIVQTSLSEAVELATEVLKFLQNPMKDQYRYKSLTTSHTIKMIQFELACKKIRR